MQWSLSEVSRRPGDSLEESRQNLLKSLSLSLTLGSRETAKDSSARLASGLLEQGAPRTELESLKETQT